MTQDTLEQFLRQKKVSTVARGMMAGARKKAWLAALGKLMSTIRQWLEPLEAEGTVAISTRTNVLTEDRLGSYKAQSLVLKVGNEEVCFVPKGTLIVGAAGRVDVVGDMGEQTLILQEGEWHVVVSRTPRRVVVPLTKDSLHDVLAQVMRD